MTGAPPEIPTDPPGVPPAATAPGDAAESAHAPARRSPLALLAVLLFVVAAVWRLIGITDWNPYVLHPTLQYESAITARTMWLHLRGGPYSPAEQAWVNDGHWRITGPPVLQSVVAVGYWAAGGERPWFATAVNLVVWLAGGLFVYRVVRELSGDAVAATASLGWYLLVPFGMSLTASFQVEAMLVAAFAAGLWLVVRPGSIDTARSTLVTAVGCAVLAFVKPGVLLFPLFCAFAGRLLTAPAGVGFRGRFVRLVAFGAILAAPSVAYGLLRMGGETAVRVRPDLLLTAFYYKGLWVMIQVSVGRYALLAGVGGLLILAARGRFAALGLVIGYGLYCAAFTWHTATHNYYHAPLVVPVAVGVGVFVRAIGGLLVRPTPDDDRHDTWALILAVWAAVYLFTSTQLVSGPWRLAPGFAARLDAERAEWHQFEAMCREVGERTGPGAGVICLSPWYGLEAEYHGWIRAAHWPYQEDVLYLTKGRPETFDAVGHLRSLRAGGMTAFAVLDDLEFRRRPRLEPFLIEHGFRRAFADDRLILFTTVGD